MKMRKKKKASVIDLKPYRSSAEIKKKIIKNKISPSRSDSEILKEIEMINKIVKAAPDIREDKIAAIKQAIKNGAYVVYSKKIAERMIRESLFDQTFKPRNRDC
jgi:negative regulator of flagellin synthesis FlgM